VRIVKAWAGAHADEKEARKLIASLETDRKRGVAYGIVNLLGCILEQRWLDENITGAYPGNPHARTYERRRAHKVVKDSQGFYTTIDMHNINCFGENTAIIDKDNGVSPLILGWLYGLGIRNLILTEKVGIHGFVPNSFAMETLASGLGRDIPTLREALYQLANSSTLPVARVTDFHWFRFCGSFHASQIHPDCIPVAQRADLYGFGPVPQVVVNKLPSTASPLHFMSWRYVPNEKGYWADLVTPIAVPDDTNWPK
jgi:hypothetical protein